MKKHYSLKTFLTLGLIVLGFSTVVAQVTLANWTFVKWMGGGATGVPAGQTISTPILSDAGNQAATAQIGSENMFSDGEGGTVRAWGTPTAAGYVRTSSMLVGTYYRIIGLSTAGYTTIKVTAGFSADSSSRYYYLQLQYRNGSTGTWVSVGDPVFINFVGETNIPVKFDNIALPVAAEGVTALELRFLQTGFDGTAVTTQSRIDNVSITAVAEAPSALTPDKVDAIKVSGANSKININGAEGLNAIVYTFTGVKVAELKNIVSNQEIPAINGIYIVKIGNKAFKVSLK